MAGTKDDPPQKGPRSENEQSGHVDGSVEVGGDVQDSNIIIGSNNTIQKNTNKTTVIKTARPKDYVIYTFLFLVLLGASGLAANFFYFRYDRAHASGDFNILILPFVEKKSLGYRNSDCGWNLAQLFTNALNKPSEGFGTPADITVLGPADRVPKIYALTEDQLNQAVETISRKINGHIVIYGIITDDEYGGSLVNVKLYISPVNFGEAQELLSASMVGELSFGSFSLIGDCVGGEALDAQNTSLRESIKIFSAIVNFLGAYLGEDFERAQQYIEEASNTKLWENRSGLEVVHLLHGNMELRRARTLIAKRDLNGTKEAIEAAKSHFQAAAAVTLSNGIGSYSRAFLGLAGAESLSATAEAMITGDLSLTDTSALDRSLEELEKAEKATYRPEAADIAAKANYSRAQIALTYFVITSEKEHLERAKSYYTLVVDEYNKTDNARIAEFAALSYTGLAHIAVEEKQSGTAINYFKDAQKTTRNPSLQIQCLVNLGDVYYKEEKNDDALHAYQTALARVGIEKALSAERISEIKKRINQIIQNKKEGQL